MKYHRQLFRAIVHERINPSRAVNAKVISLDDAPRGYQDFDKGESVKYLIDPHGSVKA
jgi:glutathione-independent formaldehyde dehydrogenase